MTESNTSLVPAERQALMNRPAHITHSNEGREHLTAQDIKMPRLVLAQSQHTDPDNSAYQKGVTVGQFFNDLTGQVYEQPISFTIVRADRPRWIEFNPREQGGGVKDMNIRAGDPRTEWRDGKPPVATQFYDFVIVLWPSREFIAVSYKSTAITATAKPLNGLLSQRDAAAYECRFQMTSFADKNKKGSFRSVAVENHPTEPWLTAEEIAFTKQAFNALKTDKKASEAFEREVHATETSEVDDSDEGQIRRAAAQATAAAPDADVPF